ncbi:MAG TPA: NAD(P)-dependent oxidoreductase [Dehalococcoidia bacterium]|nr:NAD(P)-dependent oxidoreductase [Dehalococcoidia bacterium]
MSERVLVTGGAGYIGSVLVPGLLVRGYEVTVVDSFGANGASLVDCCRYPCFTPVRGDVRDESLMRSLVARADVVIPLAALVGAPLCERDPVAAVSTNRDAILMLQTLLSPGQKLIYPTTNSGYGIGEKDSFCTEETPLRPVSLYGQTKVEAERAILDSGRGVSLRLATVFGMSPRMRLDLLVNDLTYRAVTDRFVVIFEGHFKRNYIHVRDVARAFEHAIENYDAMSGEPYNAGLSEANLSKIELCEAIQRHVPEFTYLEAPIGEDPDKRDYIVSNAKLEATGFRTEWSLDDGIDELVKGYTMLRRKEYSNV